MTLLPYAIPLQDKVLTCRHHIGHNPFSWNCCRSNQCTFHTALELCAQEYKEDKLSAWQKLRTIHSNTKDQIINLNLDTRVRKLAWIFWCIFQPLAFMVPVEKFINKHFNVCSLYNLRVLTYKAGVFLQARQTLACPCIEIETFTILH